MKHIYGPPIDLNNADVFTMRNEISYAAYISVLSNIYMKAHASSPYRTEPYKAALIINSDMIEPYQNQANTPAERIIAIDERMISPEGGVSLSILVTDDNVFAKESKKGLKHTVSHSWPMTMPNVAKDVITLHLPPEKLGRDRNIRYFHYDKIKPALIGHQVIQQDFKQDITDVFKIFERSKVHVCYQGGTAWLSISLGIPTIIVHTQPNESNPHLKYRLFGQTVGTINIFEDGKIKAVKIHPFEHHIHIKKLKAKLDELCND